MENASFIAFKSLQITCNQGPSLTTTQHNYLSISIIQFPFILKGNFFFVTRRDNRYLNFLLPVPSPVTMLLEYSPPLLVKLLSTIAWEPSRHLKKCFSLVLVVLTATKCMLHNKADFFISLLVPLLCILHILCTASVLFLTKMLNFTKFTLKTFDSRNFHVWNFFSNFKTDSAKTSRSAYRF